ncbi:o-succinylbenzoate--CoA ligase [Listeria innocua]|uniref:o-succinylbenzoate--CoA ligase n=1 Tax=Listeria innocua TaxID=1642 RepID=UPI000D91A68E|nr:o-succinylbenzoate--CoA ligase [Listeria innocua]EAD5765183.1 o-succinylbenzoate--CoA ligase [Listeria innocua]ECC1772773.1 o-succinylbenzoate--CoA ligase [Listeria innocua]EDO1185445.1 o-succinylbenzoate--CoA ligase [Listeria innocua]EDO1196734.1 o-succinylbenzoate--CoA ligase [Listeria innocua]EGX6726170.1 o-succinylbenzoate--CoA ligase [Listeria innocua]
MDMTNWLQKRVRLSPGETALVFEGKQETFEEIYEAVEKLAGKLFARGIRKDMMVALLGKNDRMTFLLIHALQQLGAITLFLNNRLTKKEITFQLANAEVKQVIVADAFVDKVTSGISYEELQQTTYVEPDLCKTWDLLRTASVMYTSGTTGKPKGVMQTYENHWWSAVSSVLNLGLTEKDSWLCAVPIFHISGLSIMMRSVIYGIPVYLEEHFDEEKITQLLESGKISTISVVTSMLERLLKIQGGSYHPNVRTVLLGGGPASKAVLEICKQRDIPLVQSFGMTETASQIVTLPPKDALNKIGSSGKALFPAEVKIADDGEILLKGPSITPGYLYNEKATAKAFIDGWFKTGDIGYLDEEGFLFVLERRSDLIISGGENIYPTEIEHVIGAYEAVEEVAVVGKSDAKWGSVPVAFIVVNEGFDEGVLKDICQTNLASFKIPKQITIVEHLPKTASGKIQRNKLKERHSN